MIQRYQLLGLMLIAALVTGCQSVPNCKSCQLPEATSCGCSGGCDQTCDCGSTHCQKYDVCLPQLHLKQRIHDHLTCGSGCSDEVYWGEWWTDPPKCDPCDCHGNYIGPQPGPCRAGLLGVRTGLNHCPTNCGTCETCTSCGSDSMHKGEFIVQPASMEVMPESMLVPSPSDQARWPLSEAFDTTTTTTTTTIAPSTRAPHRLGVGTH